MIVKAEKERVILREGGKILGEILYKVSLKCKAGVLPTELDSYTRELMNEYGVKPAFLGFGNPPFPAVICISVNSGVVHGIPSYTPLKDGDILTLDSGIWHEGLCTDSAITIGVGNISKEDQKLLNAAYEARQAQIDVAVAGNTTGDIGNASGAVARKYGYGFPEELGGHGVGKAVHEAPFIPTGGKTGTGTRLEEGMVLALEPILLHGNGYIRLADDEWLYETQDGSRSAQYEHTIIVGSDKAEVLTQIPPERT